MSELTLESSKPLQQAFSIGSWRVDPELNQLTEIANQQHQQTLEPRLMHLLCYLAANPGRVLTREQLTDELWPRVIVNENSLTRAVSALRKNLASPGLPGTGYLQTIPKRGYRLICPPQLAADVDEKRKLAADFPPAPLATVSTLSSNWRRPLQLAAFLLLVASTVKINHPADKPDFSELAQSDAIYDQVVDQEPVIVGGQLSFSALDKQGAANSASQFDSPSILSPDGMVRASIRNDGGLSTIYLARTTGHKNDPVAIFSTEDYLYNLGWSPIGNALLIARQPVSLLPTRLANPAQHADLVMLDLDTLTMQVLIDNSPEPQEPAAV